MKECRSCKCYKSHTYFWKNRTKAQGISDVCKSCEALMYEEATERLKASKSKYPRYLPL